MVIVGKRVLDDDVARHVEALMAEVSRLRALASASNDSAMRHLVVRGMPAILVVTAAADRYEQQADEFSLTARKLVAASPERVAYDETWTG